MLAAVKGIVHGNTVIIPDEDMRKYDGAEVIVTLLDTPHKKSEKPLIDWDSYTVASPISKNVEEYMKEMRDDDRM